MRKLIQLDSAQLGDSLAQLLPQGSFWSAKNDPDSVLRRVLVAIAEEAAKVQGATVDRVRESDPRTTSELLQDWEAELGLPDPCAPDPISMAQRVAAVVAKYTAQGGQSAQFFIDLAAALGFQVTIEEHGQFRAGEGVAGEEIAGADAAFAWTVHAPPASPLFGLAGTLAAGDPIVTAANAMLSCGVDPHKPAYTVVLYKFDGPVDASSPDFYAPWSHIDLPSALGLTVEQPPARWTTTP